MKVLVLSDIHSNLAALEAVLEDGGRVDAFWCLGDLVGYGPQPNQCIERVRSLPQLTCVLGNHDAASTEDPDLDQYFNPDARRGLLWTREQLSPDNAAFLTSLPVLAVRQDYTLVHGSPRDPTWEYVLDRVTARAAFSAIRSMHCLVGHSHFPLAFILDPSNDSLQMVVPVSPTKLQGRVLLNPGSVGQPRDRDPRASYALLDTEEGLWTNRRVVYDISGTQALMRQLGLPEQNAARLGSGW